MKATADMKGEEYDDAMLEAIEAAKMEYGEIRNEHLVDEPSVAGEEKFGTRPGWL